MTDNKPIVVIEHKKRTIILPIKIGMYIGAGIMTYIVYTQLNILDELETTVEKDIKQALKEFGIDLNKKENINNTIEPAIERMRKQPTKKQLTDFFNQDNNTIEPARMRKQPTKQQLIDFFNQDNNIVF